MKMRIEVLKKGDTVLNVWEGNIAIRRKNGEVEIVHYEVGDDGLPRLSPNSVLITFGDGVIRTSLDDSPVEIGTF